MKPTTQQIINQFHEVDKQISNLKTMIFDYLIIIEQEKPETAITDIREMNSMQMIEEILQSSKPSLRTIQFITGLRDHHNNRGTLSESQRFHLETTYSDFRNNPES